MDLLLSFLLQLAATIFINLIVTFIVIKRVQIVQTHNIYLHIDDELKIGFRKLSASRMHEFKKKEKKE